MKDSMNLSQENHDSTSRQETQLNSALLCSLVQFVCVVVVRVILVGVLGVMIVVLIGHDKVLVIVVIYVAIFVVIFCNWRCTLYISCLHASVRGRGACYFHFADPQFCGLQKQGHVCLRPLSKRSSVTPLLPTRQCDLQFFPLHLHLLLSFAMCSSEASCIHISRTRGCRFIWCWWIFQKRFSMYRKSSVHQATSKNRG